MLHCSIECGCPQLSLLGLTVLEGRDMFRSLTGLGFVVAIGLVSPVRAEAISPDTGLQAKLGTVSVDIYYHKVDAGYQVVTTASTSQPDSVVRFVSVLTPGQDAVVSVPGGAGQAATEVHLRRIGDRMELDRGTS